MEHDDSGLNLRYLIVSQEKGGFGDLLWYAVVGDIRSFFKFIDTNTNTNSFFAAPTPDHRWIIFVSILIRKIIAFFAKPMEWTGLVIDFLLNLLSHNGDFFGLLLNLIHGRVVVPRRGSETFISSIGQLDTRVDLHDGQLLAEVVKEGGFAFKPEMGNRALMDLCMMSSKIAYEKALFIKNIVNLHWKAIVALTLFSI